MREIKIDLAKTAVLVIDIQKDLVNRANETFPGALEPGELGNMIESGHVIENTARLIEAARKVGIPIMFATIVHRRDKSDWQWQERVTDSRLHGPAREDMTVEGTPGADVVDELKPLPADYIITKRRSSSFYGTDLEMLLHSLKINTLIIAGIVTGGCVESTFRSAKDRDFNLVVASDCCADYSRKRHDNSMKDVFSNWGQVRTADEIVAVMEATKD